MLTSTALVLLMTPGLALFYGGQAHSKSVLNMMMMVFSTFATVGVLWVIVGYSLAFGDDVGGGLLGNPSQYFMLSSLLSDTVQTDGLPDIAFAAFQAMFAILTVGLIAGAVANRMKFNSWMVFSLLWALLVYFPIAHWVFDLDAGWIASGIAAVDFAGGTAVHINAGMAALVLALILGKRRGWPNDSARPHNLTMVMLGAGLLWFGWFGFNAGSAAVANFDATYAFMNTVVATCTAICGWLIIEQVRDGKPTSLGAASGIVAGLVAITPACAAVTPLGAMAIGFIAGLACAFGVGLKYRFGFDDAFDVVGVHLVGGLVGTLLIGFFAWDGSPAGAGGVFYGGGFGQLGIQALAAGAVIVYTGILTAVIALVVKAVMGLRIEDEAEAIGIDEAEHAESGYDYSGMTSRTSSGVGVGAATTQVPAATTTDR
ncbi:ammonium transporter [Actinomycetospora sp. NBRC 106378]|uniref:ammonium transporter n=1 Tax=Actinomycetospora sp. NBRC 106378 TaxID=3032208 RepID=UPI0024A4426E|nr:ammonium transporter [Actinomycetospora sp. NBRC 106378]GLZ55711.1 putative ammonia channel [Actinomycetospora sp. NBRC 106378]